MAWRPERKRRDLALGKDAGAAIGRKREREMGQNYPIIVGTALTSQLVA
jgi:hypothetical protein